MARRLVDTITEVNIHHPTSSLSPTNSSFGCKHAWTKADWEADPEIKVPTKNKAIINIPMIVAPIASIRSGTLPKPLHACRDSGLVSFRTKCSLLWNQIIEEESTFKDTLYWHCCIWNNYHYLSKLQITTKSPIPNNAVKSSWTGMAQTISFPNQYSARCSVLLLTLLYL